MCIAVPGPAITAADAVRSPRIAMVAALVGPLAPFGLRRIVAA